MACPVNSTEYSSDPDDDVPVIRKSAANKKRAAPKSSSDDIKSRKKPASKSAAKITTQDFEPSETNLNERLTEPLLALAKEELELGNKFKGISIKNAALTLTKYPKVLTSGQEAMKLKGVGKSIAKKIDDILTTGTIQKSDYPEVNQDEQTSIEALSKIYGVSKTLATKLVREDKIASAIDLMSKTHLLEGPARIGLKYFKDFQQDIPRTEVELIVDFVKNTADNIDNTILVGEYGPYGRGSDQLDEIQVLIGVDNKDSYSKLLKALEERHLLIETISSTAKSVKTVCRLPEPEAPKAATPIAEPPRKTFSIPKFSQIRQTASSAQTPNMFSFRTNAPDESVSNAAVKIDVNRSEIEYRHRRVEFRRCTKLSYRAQYSQLTGSSPIIKKEQDPTKKQSMKASTEVQEVQDL